MPHFVPWINGNSSYNWNANHSYRPLCKHGNNMERLSERITRLRTERGLSRRAVGEACQVSHVAVGKWENGETENIKLSNLLSLARLFGTTVGDLLQERQARTGTALTTKSEVREPDVDGYRDSDESTLIRAFRAADSSARSLLIAQARSILATHTRTRSADAA